MSSPSEAEGWVHVRSAPPVFESWSRANALMWGERATRDDAAAAVLLRLSNHKHETMLLTAVPRRVTMLQNENTPAEGK